MRFGDCVSDGEDQPIRGGIQDQGNPGWRADCRNSYDQRRDRCIGVLDLRKLCYSDGLSKDRKEVRVQMWRGDGKLAYLFPPLSSGVARL
jgi:hypothetical protein